MVVWGRKGMFVSVTLLTLLTLIFTFKNFIMPTLYQLMKELALAEIELASYPNRIVFFDENRKPINQPSDEERTMIFICMGKVSGLEQQINEVIGI